MKSSLLATSLFFVFVLGVAFWVATADKIELTQELREVKLERNALKHNLEKANIKLEQQFIFRDEVSRTIEGYRRSGNLDSVARFYNTIVQDMAVTYMILSAAEVYQIPENVLFALIQIESNFNRSAYNGNNANGTNDRGLMQLNSRYFPGVDRDDPYENLRYGCQHLRERYERYGSWDEAVMYYNGFSKRSADHQSRVLNAERTLDRRFSQFLSAATQITR